MSFSGWKRFGHRGLLLSIPLFAVLGLLGGAADEGTVGFTTAATADSDADGLDDATEAALGTNSTLTDTDGDGLPDGVEQAIGTNPLVADNPSPVLPVSGARLHLQANLGVERDAAGNVWGWHDLSGNWNDAFQTTGPQMPLWRSASMGTQPAMHFDGTDDMLQLPDVMNGATEGELFVVARLNDLTARANGVCHFGTGDATAYSYANDWVWDDFGTAALGPQASPRAALLTFPHVLNSTVSLDGESVLRFNGQEHLRRSGQTVSFRSDPMLGTDVYGEWFSGDIAEVVAYDHALSDAERLSVENYLEAKYSTPKNIDSDQDGLYDWMEAELGTDPSVADTDGMVLLMASKWRLAQTRW